MHSDRDVAAAAAKLGPLLHEDAELTPFFGRGGKLLTSIGWNDYHNPDELIGYGRSPIGNAGPQARDAVRLFTVPGMGHCFGRLGCDTFDKLGILDAWLDRNIVTKRAITSKVSEGRVVRNRPLCAVPRVARYDGSGDLDDAKSFACAEP